MKKGRFERTKNIVKLAFKKVMDPFFAGGAAEISFFLLIALVPATILIVQLSGIFTISLGAIRDVLSQYLSKELMDTILPLLGYKPSASVGIFLIILALWAGSKFLFSMMRITNHAYYGSHPGKSPLGGYIASRLRAFFTIVLVLATLIFAIYILVFGEYFVQIALKYLNDFLGQDYSFSAVWYTTRWVIAYLLFFFMVSSIYFVLPEKRELYYPLVSKNLWRTICRIVAAWLSNQRKAYRKVLPGSFFASLAMLVSTFVYAYYIKHIAFRTFNVLYGGLSSIVVLLIWFYVMSFIMIVGIQINAAIEEYDKKEIFDPYE
ncbi:MAG: YihY/virulence factor BrkB family protein [Clostridiales Family XIII bacterium]|jgi:membrane protein|nr:YihY/virulence factor BrkB family protein [Clostridiales Family XIII bacterium]